MERRSRRFCDTKYACSKDGVIWEQLIQGWTFDDLRVSGVMIDQVWHRCYFDILKSV